MRIILIDRRRPRSDNHNLIPVAFGFILGMIGTVFLPWCYQMINTQPDFNIAVDPPGCTSSTYSPKHANIKVFDDLDMYHWRNYKGQIALVAYEMQGKTLPVDIEVDFIPQRFYMNGSHQTTSKMTMTPKRNASIGHHLIEICALSGDSRKRCCLYDFEVTSS